MISLGAQVPCDQGEFRASYVCPVGRVALRESFLFDPAVTKNLHELIAGFAGTSVLRLSDHSPAHVSAKFDALVWLSVQSRERFCCGTVEQHRSLMALLPCGWGRSNKVATAHAGFLGSEEGAPLELDDTAKAERGISANPCVVIWREV